MSVEHLSRASAERPWGPAVQISPAPFSVFRPGMTTVHRSRRLLAHSSVLERLVSPATGFDGKRFGQVWAISCGHQAWHDREPRGAF
jgi:hypothetical protein